MEIKIHKCDDEIEIHEHHDIASINDMGQKSNPKRANMIVIDATQTSYQKFKLC
jgi:hypothetical protein